MAGNSLHQSTWNCHLKSDSPLSLATTTITLAKAAISSNNAAIVTGASRGIGKAISLHLISKGVSVVGVARSADAINSTSEETNKTATNGAQFIPVVGDVTDEAVQHLIQKVLTLLRPVHGRIINLSSYISQRAFPDCGVYGASKAGVNYATHVLAVEEPEITVVAIEPGIVDTPMFESAAAHFGKSGNKDTQNAFNVIHERTITTEIPGTIIGNLALRADHSLSGRYVEYNQPEIAEYAK
ncbi:NAD(P)-binding protein [Martensiomyces pterosporus]|nr:NAD(P)-binding protein [Martensiomyces pterosporus]